MPDEVKKVGFRLFFLIAAHEIADKASALLDESNVPVRYHFKAHGTATSEMMDVLGLDGAEKNVLMGALTKPDADALLKTMYRQLRLGTPNSGVAFTVALSGGSDNMLNLIEMTQAGGEISREGNDAGMADGKFVMVAAIVNMGCSEDVMDAAKPAGATGGTVFHSRRTGTGEATSFWGVSVQPEREVVLILARKESKMPIMQAIEQKCGMNSEAQGVVLSVPVDSVAGLD